MRLFVKVEEKEKKGEGHRNGTEVEYERGDE